MFSFSVMQSTFRFPNVKILAVPTTSLIQIFWHLRTVDPILREKKRLDAMSALENNPKINATTTTVPKKDIILVLPYLGSQSKILTKQLTTRRPALIDFMARAWISAVIVKNKLSNFPLSLADASHEFQIHVYVRILTIKISQWARMNFCSYHKNVIRRAGLKHLQVIVRAPLLDTEMFNAALQLRRRPHYFVGTSKSSFTSSVRATVHTNPSRKRSVSPAFRFRADGKRYCHDNRSCGIPHRVFLKRKSDDCCVL